MSEDQNLEIEPTRLKTDSSSCFGIEGIAKLHSKLTREASFAIPSLYHLFLSLVFLCAFSCLFSAPIEKYSLVICAVFRDESFFLKEWIEFHQLMGVDHFYLYNNSSTDNYLEVLSPYIESGLIDLIDWPVDACNQKEYLTLLQLPAYNHALSIVKETAHWAAFIDLDEFLCPKRHANVVEMLKEYKDCAGLVINWQTFGTSGIQELEQQLITENLIWKAPSWWEINKYIKILVQPSTVQSFSHPHYCLFKEGFFAVNSDKIPLNPISAMQPVLIDTIQINHYWFGDRNWFLHHKLPRRKKWGISITPSYLDQFIESFNQEKDESILKFVPQLKENLLGNSFY